MAKVVLLNGECVFKLDNSGGTLTALSDDVTRVTLTKNITRGSYTPVNAMTPVQVVVVPYSWQVVVEYVKTKTDTTGMAYHMNAWNTGTDNLRSVEIYDDDEVAGSYKWSGEVALGSPGSMVDKQGGGGDPEKASVTLVGSGDLSYAVVT